MSNLVVVYQNALPSSFGYLWDAFGVPEENFGKVAQIVGNTVDAEIITNEFPRQFFCNGGHYTN